MNLIHLRFTITLNVAFSPFLVYNNGIQIKNAKNSHCYPLISHTMCKPSTKFQTIMPQEMLECQYRLFFMYHGLQTGWSTLRDKRTQGKGKNKTNENKL
jgi:hypothetical protein